MLDILHTFTTQAILDVHNHLAQHKGKPLLKSWAKSKQALVDRITSLGTTAEIEKSIKATETPEEKASKKGGKKGGKKSEPAGKKPRGQGVGAAAMAYIAKHPGAPAQEIVDHVKGQFPDCSISVKSVGFYRHKMRKAGDIK